MEDKYNIYVVGNLTHSLVNEQEMLDILLDYADRYHEDTSQPRDIQVELVKENGEIRFLTKSNEVS